jgi:hypothetical protein
MSEQETQEQGEEAKLGAETTVRASQSSAASGFNLGAGATSGNVADPRDAEIERLKAELQRERVEHGRVKALAQSDSEKSRRIESLEREVEELKNASQDYLDMLPPEMRDQVDPGQLKVIGTIASKLQSKRDEEFRRRDAERDAEVKRIIESDTRSKVVDVERKIEGRFPGFIQETSTGGDKCDPWLKYLRSGKQNAVLSAYNNGEFEVLSTFISEFLSQIGSSTRGRATGAVASPRTTSSAGFGGVVGDDSTLTFQEYSSRLEQAGEGVLSGSIDEAKYKAIVGELNQARDDGRVTA